MVRGMKVMKDLDIPHDLSVYAIGIVQEESCEGLAIKHAIEEETGGADYVVLGECTDLDIYRGHRGRMEILMRTKGRACHASKPDRGDNAVTKMAPIIQGVHDLNLRLEDKPFLGKGSVVLSKIECQTASLNAVPDECTIYIDRRLSEGEDRELALQQLREVAGDTPVDVEILNYKEKCYTGMEVETEKYYPTWVLDEEHPLVGAGVDTAERLFGAKPKVHRWDFSTDGVYTMGRAGIPTIGFGPSREEYAHTADDQVPIDHLVKADMFFALFPHVLSRAEE
jgi:putative selenium metabolism hydrolase